VPKIVMLPLFMLWFGIGDLSKILIIALACFYPMYINAYYGAKVDLRAAGVVGAHMGADRRRSSARWCCERPAADLRRLRVSLALSFIVMFAPR